MQLAQAVGQVFQGKRGILEVDAALQAGIQQWTVRLHLEAGVAAGGQVGVDGLGQLQIDRPAGGKVQFVLVLERQAAPSTQIGLFAGYMQRVEMEDGMVKGEMGAAFALKMNAGDRDRHLPQTSLATHIREPRQRAFESDRAGQRRLAVQSFNVSRSKERCYVELRKIEFDLGGIVAAERRLAVRGELGRLQPGCQVVCDDAVGGSRRQCHATQRFSAQSQTFQIGVGFKARVVECSRALHGKSQLAGHHQAVTAQSFNAGHIDPRAFGVQLKASGGEVVAARCRNFSRVFAHCYRGQFDGLVGNVALRPNPRNGLAEDASLVQLNPSGAGQCADGPVGLKLRGQ